MGDHAFLTAWQIREQKGDAAELDPNTCGLPPLWPHQLVLTSQRSYNLTKHRNLLWWTKVSVKIFGWETVHTETITTVKTGYACTVLSVSQTETP